MGQEKSGGKKVSNRQVTAVVQRSHNTVGSEPSLVDGVTAGFK
jgi:hypothetical protein